MPAIYDVTAHPLLSGGARFLTPDELDAQSMLAEALLGLDDATEYTEEPELGRAKMAVALQVSYQTERGVDAAVATSKTEGSRSISYRESLTHPMAANIAASLTADTGDDDFATVLSLRGTGTPPASQYG